MEIFTLHDLFSAVITMAKTYSEMNGALAAAFVGQLLLPFHDFNTTTVLTAIGAAAILWRKKSWIVSGVISRLDMRD